MCVSNNIHNFVLSFIHIYMHVLTPFFKLALGASGTTPTTGSHKRIQEELAGFFLEHVIDKKGRYHGELNFSCGN